MHQQKLFHLDDEHFWAQCRRLDKIRPVVVNFFSRSIVVRSRLLEPGIAVVEGSGGAVRWAAVFEFAGVGVRLAMRVDLWRSGLDARVADLLQVPRFFAIPAHVVAGCVASSAPAATASPAPLAVAVTAASAGVVVAVAAFEESLERSGECFYFCVQGCILALLLRNWQRQLPQ